MLKKHVTAMLQSRFPDVGIEFGGAEASVIATIPPKNNSWKPIVVCDDGNEVTVYYGNLTHVHYGEDFSDEDKVKAIAVDVAGELEGVFNDQIEFWKSFGMSDLSAVGSESLSLGRAGSGGILWSGKTI